MGGLSVASNDTAAVDLSAKIDLLCLECSKYVKNDKNNKDGNDPQQAAANLNTTSKAVQKLLNSPNGRRLERSQELIIAVDNSLLALKRLEQDRRSRLTSEAISRIKFRALKWLFTSKDVEGTVHDLVRCTQAMSLALQGVQTYVANAEDLKYFVMTNGWSPRSNPSGFLRTYQTGQRSHDEVYSFFEYAWEDTYFFLDYARGHIDNDYEEVPAEEADQRILEKLRRQVERELQEQKG